MAAKEPVAWCRDCQWWLPAADIGGQCPSAGCPRTLIKRVGYICQEDTPVGKCHNLWFKVQGLKSCKHEY